MSIGRRPLSKKSEPLTVEIFLDHYVPDITQRTSLTSAFIKFLCYQKGQIPVPYNQLENRLKAVQSELIGDLTSENHQENSSVPKMKERIALQKTKRKKTLFSKNASNFISTLTEMDEIVSCSFNSGSNNQVALILGTSVFNPLETYILDWSEYPSNNMINATESTDIARNLKQNQATLFRHLVTAEQLFPVLHPIKKTKLHIMISLRGSVVTPLGCLPRLNFKFPKTRGHQVILKFRRNELISRNLLHCKEPTESEHSETSRVCRRLIFYSPIPKNSKRLKDDSSLEISGILQIDDDSAEKGNLSSTLETDEDLCWFQLQNSLQGFQDIF